MYVLVCLDFGQLLCHYQWIFAFEDFLALELEIVRTVVRFGVPMLGTENLLTVTLHDHDDTQFPVALGAPELLRFERLGGMVLHDGPGTGGLMLVQGR